MRNGCQISTVKRSHSQEISQPKKISQPRDPKRSHSQEISQPKNLTAKRSQEISQPREKSRTKLRFRILHFQILREVSHESFAVTPYTFRFLRDVSHESFVFTSSTFTFYFEGKSCTKASFSHLPLSDFEGSLARNQILREVLCGMCRGRLLWRRDPFLEQVLSQRRADMIWDCVESWDEVRGADKSWHLLRRCEKSLDDVRKGEKRWEVIRWADMSCGKLRRVEKSCENLRKAEISWDEKRWEKLRWHEKRWEQLWSAEKSWERERRHQMGWGDEVKNLRRHQMSWDEMGWHRLRWQRDATSSFQEKLRCDEIRWNEKRFNIQKAWHQIDKSGACCGEAQEACLSPICTAFAPLYRLSAFQIWNFRPRLARVLLCIVIGLYCIVLYCIVLYCAVLCCVVLYCVVLWRIVL